MIYDIRTSFRRSNDTPDIDTAFASEDEGSGQYVLRNDVSMMRLSSRSYPRYTFKTEIALEMHLRIFS